jgi:hypothetical protein
MAYLLKQFLQLLKMEKMIRIHIICAITLLLSCESQKKEKAHIHEEVKNDNLEDVSIQDSNINTTFQDTVEQIYKEEKSPIKKPKSKEKISYTRMVQFPDENGSNGKPCIYQMDYSIKQYESDSTYVLNAVKDLYNLSERSFPVSISCDFENGTSTEHIHYQKISFQVQLFENEFAETPYKTKFYKLKKQVDGTFQIE